VVLSLFHLCDPDTSQEAAERHDASGNRARNAEIVYRLVLRAGGLTAIELWEEASPQDKARLKEPQEIRRRLTDLRDVGRVVQGLARRCRVRGTRMVTWGLSL
jgi:hypothetical protein